MGQHDRPEEACGVVGIHAPGVEASNLATTVCSPSSPGENAQPTYKTAGNLEIALGHNGNLINTRELSELAGEPSDSFGPDATSDTDVIASLIADSGKENAEEAIMEVLPKLTE